MAGSRPLAARLTISDGVYRCGFAKTKGPAVCTHGTGYRQERLEGALMAKFREAMTAPMIETLARMVNAQLEAVFQGHGARTAELAREIERLEGQASHLVRFLATGGDSPAVRAELRVIETTLAGLRGEWATIEKASALPPPRVHPAWVMTKLERLDALLRQDPHRAKVEILKHLDGDLMIVPRPSGPGERRAEISGRAKGDSLLRDQEAVCLQAVAGARNHRNRLTSASRLMSSDWHPLSASIYLVSAMAQKFTLAPPATLWPPGDRQCQSPP